MSVETRPGEETSVLRARRRSMPRPGDLARRLERAIGEGFGRRRAQPFDSALRLLVVAFALWQFVDLVHRSAAEYADYSLTVDFGIANQAWWALGHGNLNPFDTLYGHPLWQEQFPLTFWLVALLNLFSTSPFTLLVFQDACIATATLLAGWWITDAVSRRLSPRRLGAAAVVLASLVALVWNPWALETAYFDYHNEPLGLVFLLGAGRAL